MILKLNILQNIQMKLIHILTKFLQNMHAIEISSLRVIAKVKGISNIADEIGITRQGLQKALSGKGNPRLENISAIMYAMGYQLMPQKITKKAS